MTDEVRSLRLAAGAAVGSLTAVILTFAVEAVFHGKAPRALAAPFLYAFLGAGLLAFAPLPALLKLVRSGDEAKRFSLAVGYGVGIGLGATAAAIAIADGAGPAAAALRFFFRVVVLTALVYLVGPPVFRAFTKGARKVTD